MASITNRVAENFGAVAGGPIEITHGSLIFNYDDDVTVAGQRLAWTGALINPRTLQATDPIAFGVGDFILDIPNGGGQGAWLKEMIDDYIMGRGNPTILLGIGEMGATGRENPVSDTGYSPQPMELVVTAG